VGEGIFDITFFDPYDSSKLTDSRIGDQLTHDWSDVISVLDE
jgi:hypothetical protein